MTRDVGRDLVMKQWQFSAGWMPAVTGGLFFGPLLLAVWTLTRLTAAGRCRRCRAHAAGADDGRRAPGVRARHFGVGLALILVAYFFLTAFRDFRDHYSAELLKSLGLDHQLGIFTNIEKWALFGSIAAMAALNLVTDHRRR